MKSIIVSLLLVSILLPVPQIAQAGMISTPDPVEKDLQRKILAPPENRVEPEKNASENLNEQFKKDLGKDSLIEKSAKESSKTNWWKWALGILVVGGIAAAAGGGGSGSSSSESGSSSGGTVTTTW